MGGDEEQAYLEPSLEIGLSPVVVGLSCKEEESVSAQELEIEGGRDERDEKRLAVAVFAASRSATE